MQRDKQARTLIGVVSSNKMEKTITVQVERLVLHPRYRKYIKRRSKFYVHDEGNEAQRGDVVRIAATRPISKQKRWRLIEILRRSELEGET